MTKTTEKVLVRVLKTGDYRFTKFEEGEMMICYRYEAIEWEHGGKVKILDFDQDPEEKLRRLVGILIEAGKAYELYNIIDDEVQRISEEQNPRRQNGHVRWIEKIKEDSLSDGRKQAIDLVFVPYCKNTLKMREDEFIVWVAPWLERCHKVRPLDFSVLWVRQRFRRGISAA